VARAVRGAALGLQLAVGPVFVGVVRRARVFDARYALVRAYNRAVERLQRLSAPRLCLAAPLAVPLLFLPFAIFVLAFMLPTLLLEAALFALLALLTCRVPCAGAPLPGSGAAARNAAHAARRAALLDGFAKQHGLVLSYERVAYPAWFQGSNKGPASKWYTQRGAALRVRLATGGGDGPPAGLLQHGDAAV
jgi:hypothetical protein